jgi:hypothetical protein
VPVAASRHADVLARDPQPLVLGGGRHHPLQQRAIAGLEIVLPVEGLACVRDPVGKRIADPLELVQAGDAGLAERRWYTGVNGKAGKGLGAKPGKLVLEATDLAPQLGARKALVSPYSKRSKRFSIEQILHEPDRV